MVRACCVCAVVLAVLVPAASARDGDVYCEASPSSLSVIAGVTASFTVTCEVGDPATQVGLHVADAAGLDVAIAPGSAPNTFAVTVTPPAGWTERSVSLRLAVDGASFPTEVSESVDVRPRPLPSCRIGSVREQPRSTLLRDEVEVLVGDAVAIGISCSSDDDGGDRPTLALTDEPRHGTLAPFSGRPGWTYTPAGGFTGRDGFSFRATNAYGTADYTVAITVRAPTRGEQDVAYLRKVCAGAPAGTSCRSGGGRRTPGGQNLGKVSHRNWPPITGVILSFPADGGGRLTGGARNDELLGHHGSDTIAGAAGSDVIWGDWDPTDNNGTQRDRLSGGPGRDFIYTSHGTNTVRGGPGNDFVWAFYGHGTIDCGPGVDKVRLSGRASAYRLRGCERRGSF